jgi:hypothetical protein
MAEDKGNTSPAEQDEARASSPTSRALADGASRTGGHSSLARHSGPAAVR